MKLTRTYRRLVRDTTINGTTLLSTDYLNHFNELVMMVEMAADMPEMLEEAAQWHFKSYQAHFADSVFQHKDLAVWAYEHAPDAWRGPMDRCTTALRARVEQELPKLQALKESGDGEAYTLAAHAFAREIGHRLDGLSAIINGAVDEAEAARLADIADSESLESTPDADHQGDGVLGQSAIDKLFD